MRHFRVKNFDKFQHYKSNTAVPTWIKMYASTLIDPEFLGLPDVSKCHLMLIWIIASQLRNRIRFDPKYVGQIIGASSKVDLEILINAGFIEIEESTLECLESETKTALERSGETTSHLLSSNLSLQEGESEGKPEPLTPDDLRDAWNEHCVPLGLPKIDFLSATRRQNASKRIREHSDVEFWNVVLSRIATSPFLLGHKNGNGDGKHKNWKANFDWLVDNDTNCVKVHEGRYVSE